MVPPCSVEFWRTTASDRMTHCSPLYRYIPHMSMNRLAIDIMHSWHIGGMQRLEALVMWRCLELR